MKRMSGTKACVSVSVCAYMCMHMCMLLFMYVSELLQLAVRANASAHRCV